jgi:hypothetical protein
VDLNQSWSRLVMRLPPPRPPATPTAEADFYSATVQGLGGGGVCAWQHGCASATKDTAKTTAEELAGGGHGSDFGFGDEEEKGPMVGGGRGGEEKGHHGQGHARGQRGTMAEGVHGILNLGATQAGGRRRPTTVVERENESKIK